MRNIYEKLVGFFNDKESGLTIFDYLFFFVIAGFSYVSFLQDDIIVTANRSWLIWESNFFNYYDLLYEWTGDYGANYLFPTFLLFALWILPLKILGVPLPVSKQANNIFLNLWYKMLPVIVFLCSTYLIYRIALLLGMGKKKAKYCMYAFLTLPIAFYSQFIFSQYDIFTVFFMLLGMFFYFNDKKSSWRFALCFGIAITFKYYAVLIFLVFLLIDEKNTLNIIKKTLLALVPLVIVILPFYGSPGFHGGVGGFTAISYINQADFSTPLGSASFVKIFCCFILLWAYFSEKHTDKEKNCWVLYLSCGICFGLFGLMMFHPQWLMFAAPFWVLSIFSGKNLKKFLWLDIVFIIVFYAFVTQFWVDGLDAILMYNGIWNDIFNLSGKKIQVAMAEYFNVLDRHTLYSILIAILLSYFVFNHPKYKLNDISEFDKKNKYLLQLRLIVACIVFAIPAFASVLTAASVLSIHDTNNDVNWNAISENVVYEQNFAPNTGSVDGINILLATYARENTCSVYMEIIDNTLNKNVLDVVLPSEKIKDCSYLNVQIEKILFDESHEYSLKLYSPDCTSNNMFAVAMTPDINVNDRNYALKNGELCNANINIQLFYK